MSRREDFEIVEDDETTPQGRPAWWWWLMGSLALIVVAGVFAAATFSQRLAPTRPATVTAPGGVAFATVVTQDPPAAPETPTPGATPTEVPTPDVTPTPSPTDTPMPEPTPTPCAAPVAPQFAFRYSADELGCPLGPAHHVWSAWQPFERGHMFWRRDTDQAYVLSNAGIYSPVTERWDGSPAPDRGAPPPGFYAPERGFGAVWARSQDIFAILGWATAPERGFCALIQDYEYGSMVTGDPIPSCTPENLYNHATAADWPPLFLRFTEAGSWQ